MAPVVVVAVVDPDPVVVAAVVAVPVAAARRGAAVRNAAIFSVAVAAVGVALAGCAQRRAHQAPQPPPPLPPPVDSTSLFHLVPAPELDDDLPLAPLLAAAEAQATLIEHSPKVGDFHFADRRLSTTEYAAALRRFAALGRAANSPGELRASVAREFEFYEAVFPEPVLVTAYYEPVIPGARTRTARFDQPLYRPPPGADYTKTPGPTRAQIDSENALANLGLELCFVDPLDAFVLQTEGSGTVAFNDSNSSNDAGANELPLDFAAINGHAHVRIGQFLAGRIPPGEMNMHTIEAYLRSLPESEMRAILERNSRYVFFKPREGGGPATSLGMPALDGRTIATDPRFVPRGGLAFLITETPSFDHPTDMQPARWQPLHRFVLTQDTGGGIKGPRVDLFWGRGGEARLYANAMKRRGRLLYLSPISRPLNQ